jgi:elongation factor G
MKLEISVPERYVGDVISDINARRGKIEEVTADAGRQHIVAFVPLAETFGYATDLRSITQGRATYHMEFHCYEEVPHGIASGIISKARGQGI